MRKQAILGANMVLATDKALYAMRFYRDDKNNLCLMFDGESIPISGWKMRIKRDDLSLKLTIHHVHIRNHLQIKFSLAADCRATLTVERPQ